MISFVVIPARGVHLPFVTDSWAACDRSAQDGWRSRRIGISQAKGVIREIIAGHGVTTLVAADTEDDEAILGWACYEPGTVHYIYLREKFGVDGWRGVPILRALLAPFAGMQSGEYTHRPSREIHIPAGWRYAG